jgi:hypothetical protein
MNGRVWTVIGVPIGKEYPGQAAGRLGHSELRRRPLRCVPMALDVTINNLEDCGAYEGCA